ncbi:MAG: TIGR03862 family flavoprotein [Pseudomonadota bacterium]
MPALPRLAVIGSGPAGLAAAEAMTDAGHGVDLYDAMPSLGRKFLMAGKSGLNISKQEPLETYLNAFRRTSPAMVKALAYTDASAVQAWMEALGVKNHVGPTGRVFPAMMKASPLLRAWVKRLQNGGLSVHTRWRWTGWQADGALSFETASGTQAIRPAATVFALGGASWSRLGATGAWAAPFKAERIALVPFQPSNGGFVVNWSDKMKSQFAGAPVKAAALSHAGQTSRSEFVITETGLESGAVYALSHRLRETLARDRRAVLRLDLKPDLSAATITKRLNQRPTRPSLGTFLRKAIGLDAVKCALVFEADRKAAHLPADMLAKLIKALPIEITGHAPLDEAISTAGGVAWDALTPQMMLKNKPGYFCAGEMVAWDAPTGGYLIPGCLATGRLAGRAAANWATTKGQDQRL